ncbi:ABC transporter ATP-binding protein [Citricoccus sp. NR2]|uniref:ABC transporter ATP-binding protein n=1 Tax=Citricoccus sp. NR2 TaxID=3004095 RepID=UPI0022DD530D|nr:ABC transporter ATP-binding protein [Citricoccus sp. NR2]WBL19443.1 ABC transporter ATP-binding protein [Citricoccus sp. NR2]
MSLHQPPAGGPTRGPAKINPDDRKQLKAHPVSLKRIAALFAPHKGTIAVVVALITVSSVVTIAQPFLLRGVIDDALPNQDVPLLLWLAGAMIAVAAITAVVGVVQTWMSTQMGQRVMHTLRSKLFTHLQAQSLSFFTRTRSGEVQSRLMNDIAGMQSVVTTTATGVATNLTTAIATFVAMFALSPTLTLISLVVLPPAVLLSRQVALLRRSITDERQKSLASLHTQVEERLSVSGARLAKTLGTTDRDAARFTETSQKLIGLEVRSQLAGRWRMATMSIVFAAIPAVIYVAAGLPVTSAGMTIGTVVAFTALQAQVFRPIMGLLNIGVQWVSAMAFFSRIFEYLDLIPELTPPEHPVQLDAETLRGDVAFRGVTFAYDTEETDGSAEHPAPVLNGIDLALPAGQTIAVVGATGSGKSTLAALLPRLYEPQSGSVTIDGVSVSDLDPDTLAQLVGVVSQETYLIHASVRENLLLARPGATDAQVWEALEHAALTETIRALPEGLDTLVGARGYRFSGGEQQRLAIARTILRNPPILVLDEATSALDNTTEAHVQAALDRLAEHRTTLMIAHRLDTVMTADRVVVLDHGRIIESGAPATLLQRDGAFAALAAHSTGNASENTTEPELVS